LLSKIEANMGEEDLTYVTIPSPPQLETLYHDVIDELFVPCLRRSKKYVRGAGYFSSSIYRLMGEELLDFCIRGGNVTLLTSTDWQQKDYNALKEIEPQNMSQYDYDYWIEQLTLMLEDPKTLEPTKMLIALISSSKLKIKVGILRDNIYHEKTGFFEDENGNIILFYGSGNESKNAFMGQGNSFNIHYNFGDGLTTSWETHGLPSMKNLLRDIDGKGKMVVEDFPDVSDDFIDKWEIDLDLESHRKSARKRSKKMTQLYDELYGEKTKIVTKNPTNEIPPEERIHENVEEWIAKRKHQEKALEKWEGNNRRGILKHATGSGKTVTAIAALERHLSADEDNFCIVVVPIVKLQTQWSKEINKFGMNTIMLGGDAHPRMQELVIEQIATNTFFENTNLVIVKDTFIGDKFRSALKQGQLCLDRCLLVFDECHRASEPRFQWLIDQDITFKSVLGLSATPFPPSDENQTLSDEIIDVSNIQESYEFDNSIRKNRVIQILGDVIDEFSLADGISKGYLTPYNYTVMNVEMTLEEQKEYDKFRKLIGKYMGMDSNPAIYQSRMVIKSITAKLRGLDDLLSEYYDDGQHWLVYCAHSDFLNEALEIVHKHTDNGWYYTSKNIDSRDEHIERFEEEGGILLAVKCLDEGVDIPLITHGIILSSSMVEREFVQRRGRMLRADKEGKKDLAYIYDLAVIPAPEADIGATESIIQNELKRIENFIQDADNAKIAKLQFEHLEKLLDLRVRVVKRRERFGF
jgi:superfamily II DNA or RNA helicase